MAGGLLEHTVGVASLAAKPRSSTSASDDLLLAAALLHDAGRTRELDRGPLFLPTPEGTPAGTRPSGPEAVEEWAAGLEPEVLAESPPRDLRPPRCPRARTAEATVLYHANQLDAAAATRPVATG